jgi:tetratricopeptide (TPR) repeat protein
MTERTQYGSISNFGLGHRILQRGLSPRDNFAMASPRISLNGRFLVWSLLALLVAGALVHLLYAVQWQRNSAALLAMANSAEAEGNKERCVRFLGQYVVRMPSDTQAMARFGFMLDEPDQMPFVRRRARRAYEEVLIRDRDRTDVRRRLALLEVALGDTNAAEPNLKLLLADNPGDAELAFSLGLCFEKKREFEAAAQKYKETLAADPANVNGYVRLALLQRGALHAPEEADKTIEKMVEVNGESWQALRARAEFRLAARFLSVEQKVGAVKLARRDLEAALKLAPDQIPLLFSAAEFYLKFGNGADSLAKARACLRKIIEKNDRLADAYEYLAGVERREGNLDAALEVLRRGLQKTPRSNSLSWSLAYELVQRGDLDEAQQQIQELAKRGSELEGGRLDLLRAIILVREGEWRLAADKLESARPFFTKNLDLTIRTDYLLAECYENLGAPQESIQALRRVLALDPVEQGRARRAIAAILVRRQQIDEALNEYVALAEKQNCASEDLVRAIELTIARTLNLPNEQRTWEPVERLLEKLELKKPDAAEVKLLRARLLLARGKPQEAYGLLETARDSKPDDIRLWLALASVELNRGKPDAASAILAAAEQKLGDLASLRLARLNLRNQDRDPALLRRLEEGLEKFEIEDRVRILEALAETAREWKEWAEARRLWSRVVALRPNDLDARFLLFEIALQQDDEAAANEALRAIQKQEGPGRPLGDFAEASLEIWKKSHARESNLPKARELLAKVETRRPRWPQVALQRGRIEELDGNLDLALAHFRRAVDLGERDLSVVRRVVQLLYERQHYEQADAVLRQLPAQLIVRGQLQQVAVEVSLQVRDADRALELARRSVPENSDDYRDHVWMGQVLEAVGKSSEAEAALRKAAKLAPTKPDPWIALVQFFARSDPPRVRDAREVIDQEIPKIGEQALLTRARCCAVLFRPEDKSRAIYAEIGRKAFQEVLRNAPDDPVVLQAAAEFFLRTNELTEADKCCQSLLALPKVERAVAARARRMLAIVKVSAGNYRQGLDALASLHGGDTGAASDPEALEDQRVTALVLARYPGREENRRAIKLLEALDLRQPLSAEDRFVLAQLYERLGDAAKFENALARVLRQRPDNIRVLVVRVGALLRGGKKSDVPEAERLLDTLERLGADDASVRELRVRLLAAKGERGQAVDIVRSWVKAKNDASVTAGAAGLCEQIGGFDAAEEFYRSYAAQMKGVEGISLLARFLARRDRLAEALDTCEAAWTRDPGDAIAVVSLAVLKAGKPREEDLRRVEAQVQAALRKEKRANLLLCLGGLAELRGRYDDAENIYRQVLEMDFRNAVAANNLAWVLALRGRSLDEALQLVKGAIDQLGPLPEMLDTRGLIYVSRGDAANAIADLTEVCQRADPSSSLRASGSFHLARALYHQGDLDKARDALEKSKTAGLNPECLPAPERASYAKLAADLGMTP